MLIHIPCEPASLPARFAGLSHTYNNRNEAEDMPTPCVR